MQNAVSFVSVFLISAYECVLTAICFCLLVDAKVLVNEIASPPCIRVFALLFAVYFFVLNDVLSDFGVARVIESVTVGVDDTVVRAHAVLKDRVIDWGFFYFYLHTR